MVVDVLLGFEGEVFCVLYGVLVWEIGNFLELVVLLLFFNGFFGEFLREIGNLKKFEMFDLEVNSFLGIIFVEIGEFLWLCVLNFVNNVL